MYPWSSATRVTRISQPTQLRENSQYVHRINTQYREMAQSADKDTHLRLTQNKWDSNITTHSNT